MNKRLNDVLACPECKSDLKLNVTKEIDSEIIEGSLLCEKCKISYSITQGIPVLVKQKEKSSSQKSWLGEEVKQQSKVFSRLWFIVSNMIGLLFSPILALFGWSLDLMMRFKGLKSSIRISDVRGLMIWHLRFMRPYDHLRMIEHALVLDMIRNSISDQDREIIVDVGAEISLFCSYLAKIGYRTAALDLDSAQMFWQHELYSKKYKDKVKHPVNFIVASATDLPLKNDSANLCAISVIEHIEDDRAVFSETGRVIGSDHNAFITFLYQEFPLRPGQKEAAWKRAREHHPAYGQPRNPGTHILEPCGCVFETEHYFWKKHCRKVKGFVNKLRIFERSVLFDYFVYVRLARWEQAVYPGKQANQYKGREEAFQWAFKLSKSNT
jgi:uncharacterized protein YbaR (Trm112 family)